MKPIEFSSKELSILHSIVRAELMECKNALPGLDASDNAVILDCIEDLVGIREKILGSM